MPDVVMYHWEKVKNLIESRERVVSLETQTPTNNARITVLQSILRHVIQLISFKNISFE